MVRDPGSSIDNELLDLGVNNMIRGPCVCDSDRRTCVMNARCPNDYPMSFRQYTSVITDPDERVQNRRRRRPYCDERECSEHVYIYCSL